jgi:hypothetical protein
LLQVPTYPAIARWWSEGLAATVQPKPQGAVGIGMTLPPMREQARARLDQLSPDTLEFKRDRSALTD